MFSQQEKLADLEAALRDVEIEGLRQVIVIDRNGNVIHAFLGIRQ